jgi:dipeptide/tripeptide permease
MATVRLVLLLSMFAVGVVTTYQLFIFFRLWLNDPSGLKEESKAQRRLMMRWWSASSVVSMAFFILFIPDARTLVLILLLTSVGWELIRTNKAWTASDWKMVTTCLLISAFFLYARMTDLTIPWDLP